MCACVCVCVRVCVWVCGSVEHVALKQAVHALAWHVEHVAQVGADAGDLLDEVRVVAKRVHVREQRRRLVRTVLHGHLGHEQRPVARDRRVCAAQRAQLAALDVEMREREPFPRPRPAEEVVDAIHRHAQRSAVGR